MGKKYSLTKAKPGATKRPLPFLEGQLEHLNNVVKRRGGKAFEGAPHKAKKK